MLRDFFITCLLLFLFGGINAQISPYSIPDYPIGKPEKTSLLRNLPDSVDNSGEIYFPPLYNQVHPVCNQVVSSYYLMSYERNLILGLNSGLPENQMSVYFPWNFNNGGYGWYGSSYLQVFEMFEKTGIPSIKTFWGNDVIDPIQWMSGYDKYRSAMQNRLDNIYSIDLSDWEGIEIMKGWLHNHLGECSPGGLSAFMGGYNWLSTLPGSSPHSGETVLYQWGSVASHARIIVGYNDSIRYDFNNDGQYTKDTDINGDGIVDLKDSEFGAFKYAESYGTDVGNNGFFWAMYKTFAEEYGDGGILNKRAYVIKPKPNYQPLLTADVELEYPKRNQLQVGIGLARNNLPTEIIESFYFPIFNYQGGPRPMQGSGEQDAENIKFSLDISEILSFVDPGESFRLYLIINFAEPGNIQSGSVKNFTINNYTGDSPVNYENSNNVSMQDYQEFPLYHDLELNFSKLHIDQDSLTDINPNEYFEKQLSGNGGITPYKWHLIHDWARSTNTQSFSIPADAVKISPDAEFSGDTLLSIPFNFPFGNSSTNKIRISAQGYIIPDGELQMTTYFRDNLKYILESTPIMAPLPRDIATCYPENGDGIWMTTEESNVWIYWKYSEGNPENNHQAEFAVCLSSDGSIKFHYGEIALDPKFRKLYGVSLGDRISHNITDINSYPAANSLITFTPASLPDINLSETGLLSGAISDPESMSIKVKLEDDHGQFVLKDLLRGETEDSNFTEKEICIYPNPCSNGIKIRTGDGQKYQLELTDMYGRIIYKTVVFHNSYVNLRPYKNSKYIVNLTSQKGKTTSFSLIKQ